MQKIILSPADAPQWAVVCEEKNESRTGSNWQDKFVSFSKNAVSSASLGQVHMPQ